MDIRILIFALILVYYFILKNKTNTIEAKNSLITFSCILLCLQSGLRHIVIGPDTAGYYGSFCLTHTKTWDEVLLPLYTSTNEFRDPGYEIIVKAFTSIFPSWQLFLLALALLYFYALRNILTKYVEDLEGALFAITLYMSLFSIIALSGIRQQITMALSMILIPLVEDKKWKVVLPIVLSGSLIHISFLFYLAFIPLQMIKKDNMKILIIFSIILIPIVATSAKSIVGFMASQVENDYYMSYAQKSVSEVKPYTYVLLCSSISIFLFTGYKYLKTAPQFFTSALILMTITVPLIMLDGTMIRIGQYFTIYMMLSVPYLIKRKYNKNLFFFLILILCLMLFSKHDEYHFCWESIAGILYNPWSIN